MTKKLTKLVLVIDLSCISPDSRLTEAKNVVRRALGNTVLDESDMIELEYEETPDEYDEYKARDFICKKFE